MPTKEMVIIVGAIVTLILICCLVRACFSSETKVTDQEIALARARTRIAIESDMDVETIRTESNLMSVSDGGHLKIHGLGGGKHSLSHQGSIRRRHEMNRLPTKLEKQNSKLIRQLSNQRVSERMPNIHIYPGSTGSAQGGKRNKMAEAIAMHILSQADSARRESEYSYGSECSGTSQRSHKPTLQRHPSKLSYDSASSKNSHSPSMRRN